MKTTIYIEGGGKTKYLKSELRQGFKLLFQSSGLDGKQLKIVASGSRNEAYSDFATAFKNIKSGETVLLLVDSEDIVSASTKWEHVVLRDSWTKLGTEENIFFMVVCMESWFLADTTGVEDFFGQNFDASKLPKNINREAIDKKQLYDGLKKATKNTSKGEYGKGQHSFKILTHLDGRKIEQHGKYSKEIFGYLRQVL
ncbi:MAG: DUF4276 family protein [Campylobacterales bacterium]|nr:DUF4276 family protein [Campylobacterales bacterium]